MNPLKGLRVSRFGSGEVQPYFSPSNVVWTFAGLTIITYVLFQKHLLPKAVSRQVAKIFFWPTMPITMSMRWANYWTIMDDTVIIGAAPFQALGHPDALHKMGVRGVINMCDEYAGPLKDYERLGIKQLRLRTVDHFVPDTESLRRGVKFIEEFSIRGEKVLVHCKAGHGRSGSITMAWLLYSNPDNQPHQIQKLMLDRRHVSKKIYLQAPIREFYDAMQKDRKS